MLDRLLRRTQPSVIERLEPVEIFNGLLQERAEIRAKEATLTHGLEQAEARLATIPDEEQGIHDNHYRNVVQREVDPSRPDLTVEHNRKLTDLKAERADLVGKVQAYGQELQIIQRALSRLQGEHEGIERARRAMWAAIAEALLTKVSPDFQAQFLRIWVALDRVRDGIPAEVALSKIASIELPTTIKVQTIEELSREFGVTNE
jgi:chromosome segregation ATPase